MHVVLGGYQDLRWPKVKTSPGLILRSIEHVPLLSSRGYSCSVSASLCTLSALKWNPVFKSWPAGELINSTSISAPEATI